MKRKLIASVVVAIVVMGAMFGGLALTKSPANAQTSGGYEYAYLVVVPRLESYEIDLDRWAGSDEDKKYLQSHVFVYEEGQSRFDRDLNSLKKINELAVDGWELIDAEAGVLRRQR